MTQPTYFKTLAGNEGTSAGSSITPEKKIIEDLILTCQRLDDYLNSSPSEQQCFITRKVIAEADEHSPIYSMAQSLCENPKAIKNSVNQIVMPVLNCLRQFIEKYSKPESKLDGFNDAVSKLYPLINGAYWYVATK